jgi:hypothetical protein
MAIAAYSAYSQNKTANANAQVMQNEAKATWQQGVQAEDQARRIGREAIGRSAAAISQAGIGTGGTASAELAQSQVGAELDALNARYKGLFTAYGYNQEADNYRQRAQSSLVAGGLNVAGAYLRSSGSLGGG